MSLIKEVVTIKHVVKIGSVDISLDNYEIAILALYLAYAVNTKVPHQFISTPIADKDQKLSIYLSDGDEFIVDIQGAEEQIIQRDQLRTLCDEIATFSENSSHLPLLIREEYWEENDCELFYHVTKANVVAIVYSDNRETSDLPVGLHLDDSGRCWGVNAKSTSPEDDAVGDFYFDKDCETYVP